MYPPRDFSLMLIEITFHLLFKDEAPLIKLMDMFEGYDETKDKPFTLNLLIKLADTDL